MPEALNRKYALLITAIALCVLLFTLALSTTIAGAAPPGKSATPSIAPLRFARDIQPLLADRCFKCHGPDPKARQANLRLDTLEGVRRAFVPKKPEASGAFSRMISTDAALLMPPPDSRKSLDKIEIARIRRWILEGANWEEHWAFQPPHRPALPNVSEKIGRIRNPIDLFLAARLAQEGLKQSPEADKPTLLRRVSLDLTGLPPTLEEADAFLADTTPKAYEKVVDRLLASPRYGERMVWEWLEAARYADTNGYQGDPYRPMWPWRDWAINAINSNMPFDQFTVEQIAGDLLPNPTRNQLIATGFHRNHPINGEGGRIAEESRVDYVQDRVETTGAVWMGLTLTCCRCHDHKFDPVTQKEYYRLSAYFNSVEESGAPRGDGLADPVLELSTPEQEKALAILRETESLATYEQRKASKKFSKESPELAIASKALLDARKAREAAEGALLRTMTMRDRKQPRDTFILARGIYTSPGEKVTHGVPARLSALPSNAPPNRLALARWLVSPNHPLTSRVVVNRMWQQFFGVGLVKTAEDFGMQGERPIHPDLLDWLASEFILSDWNVKRMHRMIVTSATYRQSSRVTPALLRRDPENRLLARAPRFRLPSWMLRDQALAVSGLLVEKLGGPSVKGYQPPGVWEEATFGQIAYVQEHGDALYRRSLYQFWRRIVGPTIFFDTPSRQNCVVREGRTNTPLHSLTTLNDVTFVEAARALAQRTLLDSSLKEDRSRLRTLFRRCAARYPEEAELSVLMRRLNSLRSEYNKDGNSAKKLISVGETKANDKLSPMELAAWTGIGLLVLNLDEALTKE